MSEMLSTWLKGSRQRFMRRFKETPRSSFQRSRSADPAHSVQSRLLTVHFSNLRLEIEKKTESLNDANFEVTEPWFFEFVNQHCEYMEQAASENNAQHYFCDTTDMFKHVLQHPNVLKLLEGWDATASTEVASSKLCSASLDASQAGTRASTEIKTRPDCIAEAIAKGSNKSDCDNPSPSDLAHTSQGNVSDKEQCCTSPAVAVSGNVDNKVIAKSRPTPKASSEVHGNALMPAPDTLHPSSGGELMQTFRQRANSTGAIKASRSTQPPSEAGELLQKLQQRTNRTSWQGLSPRSQRLAGRSKSGSEPSELPEAGNLAERRKLLEGRLASCGFQRYAPSLGA